MHQIRSSLPRCRMACNIPLVRMFGASARKPKTAIVMMNMGGPQTTDEVGEYLMRIMTDRDMIQLPFQKFLGPFIARRRTKNVQEKYKEIGGGSPILKWTNIQGELMCQKLDQMMPETAPHKHYVAFRYANPLTETTLEQIEKDGPETVIFFSQYPQYSCSTSGSSFNAIYDYYKNRDIPNVSRWAVIDRWPTHPYFIRTFAAKIKEELEKFKEYERDSVELIFSAHSLPMKVVERGDPYPFEVGFTVRAVMEELNIKNPYIQTWQSKVGPVPWLEPFTDDVIRRNIQEGKREMLLIPIAFVNEHIETLHELDIEYIQEIEEQYSSATIRRVPTPNDHPLFIDALADIVSRCLKGNNVLSPRFQQLCSGCTNARCKITKDWFRNLCYRENY